MYVYISRLMTLYVLLAGTACTNVAPTGAMADYHLNCGWAVTRSKAACADLLEKLEDVAGKTAEEKLALLETRTSVTAFEGDDFTEEEFCGEVSTIVEEHPRYAEALYSLSHCTNNREETVGLLRKALEIEPDNYNALSFLLLLVHGIFGSDNDDLGIDAETLSKYRDAYYEIAKRRSTWEFSQAPTDSGSSNLIWQDLLRAAVYIYSANVRAGDHNAVEALRFKVRRDIGLDGLDFSAEGSCHDEWDCRRGSGEDNLRLACDHNLQTIGLEEVCVAAIEKLVEEASMGGEELSEIVLSQLASTVYLSRRRACVTTDPFGDECLGLQATETVVVARLRAALENYTGDWSSEHHRVYAQGFLGDSERLEGLRGALQVNPHNDRARCDLARALEVRGESDEARTVLGDGDPECLKSVWLGFTLGDRDDVLKRQEETGRRFLEIRN